MSKTFVGIQVGAISFVDEGVEKVLDILEEQAGVNAILISALSWSIGNAGPCTAAQGESCSLGGISKKTASVTFTPESGEPVVILKP